MLQMTEDLPVTYFLQKEKAICLFFQRNKNLNPIHIKQRCVDDYVVLIFGLAKYNLTQLD